MMSYRFAICSSLEKVFADKVPLESKLVLQAFLNESTSFQLGVYLDSAGVELLESYVNITVTSTAQCDISLYNVRLMPANLVCSGDHDSDYLRTTAGMYPDLLEPMEDGNFRPVHGQWRAVWVKITPKSQCNDGVHPLEITVTDGVKSTPIWQSELSLTIMKATLPEQSLIHTEMLHADCLADYYNVPVFSPAHWDILERFIKYAVQHGVNMIFTPLFTPPMDTAQGGERTTVQLVQVYCKNDKYEFDFTLVDKWIKMCLDCGAKYIEAAPLFTQWGAYYAPKIIAEINGEVKQIFGWDTDAASDEYHSFLRDFLTELQKHLQKTKHIDKTWFHVSDEPRECHMVSYKKAQTLMRECLPNSQLFDACSDYELYKQGAVLKPVVANNHIEPFLQAKTPNLWTYYCCVQGVDVANRFFAMPSYRNRIIGVQAYLYNLEGFLHWGYNFYNTRYSIKHISPFEITDCGESFPSGDAFLVYPSSNGTPIGSVRIAVLSDAMNDLRALRMLEGLTSKQYVHDIIKELAGMNITFSQYPRSADFLLRLRNKVNTKIMQML